tara:strand:- start:9 stop:998 length:990 start_codon:yes stop_codon:yes gene_type:complete
MPSAWNKDTPIRKLSEVAQNVGQKIVDNNQTIKAVSSVASAASSAASAVSSSLPTWQSVVDTAAEAMEGVSGRWTDVAGKAYELLPEGEDVAEALGNIPSPIDTLTGTMSKAATTMSKAATIFKAVTSPVGLNFLNDILVQGRGTGNPLLPDASIAGAEVFSQGGMDLMRKLVIDAGILESGSVTIGAETIYESDLGAGISLNQSGGSSAGTIIKSLASGNPADEVRTMLGQFSAYIDDNNDIIIDNEQFNYNNFVNPLDGQVYDAEQYEAAIEAGKFTELEVLISIFSAGKPDYKMVRAAGFILGSKEYKDDSKDQGRKFEINLGPAN